jgi:hypothetical protein
MCKRLFLFYKSKCIVVAMFCKMKVFYKRLCFFIKVAYKPAQSSRLRWKAMLFWKHPVFSPTIFADRWIHFEKRKNHDLDLNLFCWLLLLSVRTKAQKQPSGNYQTLDFASRQKQNSNANFCCYGFIFELRTLKAYTSGMHIWISMILFWAVLFKIIHMK